MGRTNCCEKNGACYNSANRPENRLTSRCRKISFAHKIIDELYWNFTQITTTLKRQCRHFDEIFITGCTESCQNDNFLCSQWWKFHQNDNISVSMNMPRCRISDVSVEKNRNKRDLVKYEFTIYFERNVMGSLRTVTVKLPLIFKALHHLWENLKSWVPVLYISANILMINNYVPSPGKRGVLNNCGANKVDFGWNVATGCFTISVLHPNIQSAFCRHFFKRTFVTKWYYFDQNVTEIFSYIKWKHLLLFAKQPSTSFDTNMYLNF